MSSDVKKQICINLPSWLINDVDNKAKELGLTRTFMITIMIHEYLDGFKVLKNLEEKNNTTR